MPILTNVLRIIPRPSRSVLSNSRRICWGGISVATNIAFNDGVAVTPSVTIERLSRNKELALNISSPTIASGEV